MDMRNVIDEVMTPKPIPLSNEKCSYRCPYYMDGPVLSLCRVTNERLVYGGTIPPKRTERCKQEFISEQMKNER